MTLPAVYCFQRRQVGLDLCHCRSRGVYEVTMYSAAGQSFQAERAAASKKVRAPGAVNIRRQPIKQGLAYPVCRGPQALCGDECELAATPPAADDAQLAVPCCPFY